MQQDRNLFLHIRRGADVTGFEWGTCHTTVWTPYLHAYELQKDQDRNALSYPFCSLQNIAIKAALPFTHPNRHYNSGIGDQNSHLTYPLFLTPAVTRCPSPVEPQAKLLTSIPPHFSNEAVPFSSVGPAGGFWLQLHPALARWHLPQQSLWVGLWSLQLPSVNKVMPLFCRVLWASSCALK